MTKKTVLLDSCVLASFFMTEDDKHREALQIIEWLFADSMKFNIILPPLVIYETSVVVIRNGYSEIIISNRLHKLLSYDQVIVISLSELAVFKHLRCTERTSRRQRQIRTHDMLILNTAIDFDAPVISFDQPLLNVCQRLNFPTRSSFEELVAHKF